MYFDYRKPKSNAEPHTEKENNNIEAEEDSALSFLFYSSCENLWEFFFFCHTVNLYCNK